MQSTRCILRNNIENIVLVSWWWTLCYQYTTLNVIVNKDIFLIDAVCLTSVKSNADNVSVSLM